MTQPDKQAAIDWFFHGEIGASSETICRAFLGKEMRHHDSLPGDCDDLSRCRLFLERLSSEGQQEALASVSTRYPDWQPLVREWSAVCASMDAECPGWRSKEWGPKTGKTGKMLDLLQVEGLRLRYPKATIETRKDGTLSSFFNPEGYSVVTLKKEDIAGWSK